jgi:hypothetical protein
MAPGWALLTGLLVFVPLLMLCVVRLLTADRKVDTILAEFPTKSEAKAPEATRAAHAIEERAVVIEIHQEPQGDDGIGADRRIARRHPVRFDGDGDVFRDAN